MTFKVTINYKTGPSFGTTVDAATKEIAKQTATLVAKLYGFNDPIKNVTVRAA